MRAAATTRAASFGPSPAVYATAVQADDVIYVLDSGAAGDLAEQEDEGGAMATYSVPHANRDARYSGYEAPGTNGGGNSNITYAVPMEDYDGVQYETAEATEATYSVLHANQDTRYSGYEAPGANGAGGNSNIVYAVPMEDDGAGRVPNPIYQSADSTASTNNSPA